jgi:hypothetical protein
LLPDHSLLDCGKQLLGLPENQTDIFQPMQTIGLMPRRTTLNW